MNRRNRVRRAAVAVVASLLFTVVAIPASAAENLIDATPASVSITAPAPGETVSWDMSVRNITTGPLPLELSISDDGGRLLEGPTPITVTVRERETSRVVAEGSPADLRGMTLTLPDLAAGAEYGLVGSATLPAQADNTYQGASATLDFRFVAVASAAPPALAITGQDLFAVTVIAAAGATVLILGLWLALSRRRKENYA
ncbi:hypothetical protein [Microbacterium sp. SORGH_AS_0862]|uniref:hypothetical protein n=1 Tax=Microbacterium sp. SORGH_AS_0862 TaxID=3041789 RepID=UPI0027918DED|nr:hypothetical protein [Microbacterium sp. SORGH_AS_0862]MDQ1205229.1 hypothetical protein [Microbacterium sp. SORGH_AS_0862]